jgi:RHH-type rel operon transcriptional repressor/antitoxin RelB
MLKLRLPPEIEQRLAALAHATGRSKAFFAREAIIRYLDRLEKRDKQPRPQGE